MVTSVNNYTSVLPASEKKSSTQALGQADFLKLLTTQMTTQDPTDPVDNKEMVAQMAQFSSLAGIAEMGDTLKAISAKLDLVLGIGGEDEAPEAEEPAADTPTDTTIPQE